jgi:FdrA protein
MLYAFLMKGRFQDSVTLMVLSRDLSALPEVNRVSVMMGTPANKDVFRETGFWHEALAPATPNDLCIAVDSEDAEVAGAVVDQVKVRLAELARVQHSARYQTARSWRRARQLLPEANVALISVAGHYAFGPARQALEDGCHVMMFSDNVSVDQEVELKAIGREKGLLVMGPDCGTAIIGKVPLAFANRIPAGPIAVVGASGTGIQELTSQIARLGSGITHALGLGGRDLSEQVGGISALMALEFVKRDSSSSIVVFVSKPPAAAVKERVLRALKEMGKPVIALFLGDRGLRRHEGNVHFAFTLDEAAALATEFAYADAQAARMPNVSGRGVCGLYTGGTLAAEAAMLLAETLDLEVDKDHAEGFMLTSGRHRIIDLGDDFYTRGRPHPMIDPSVRNDMIRGLANDASTGVLLLDIVLGYGGHRDPAGEAATAVTALRAERGAQKPIIVIATVTGTAEDPQDRASQAAKLEEAGVVIAESTRIAIALAAHLVSKTEPVAGEPPALLRAPPAVINVGLRGFADDLQGNGVRVVHLQWEPAAGGNERLQRLLAGLH